MALMCRRKALFFSIKLATVFFYCWSGFISRAWGGDLHPLFELHVHTRHKQYFSYSPVVASGYMVAPLQFQNITSDRFYLCISAACMFVSKQPVEKMSETFCRKTLKSKRNHLEDFVCKHGQSVQFSSSIPNQIVRFEPMELGYANIFGIGKKSYIVKVFNDEKKLLLLGVDRITFTVDETPPFSGRNEFQFIAEKGLSVTEIAREYCFSLNDPGIKQMCAKTIINTMLYDFDHSLLLKDANKITVDMTSVFGLAPSMYESVELQINGKPQTINFPSTFRMNFCHKWSNVCMENGLSSNDCSTLIATVSGRLKKETLNRILSNPYYSQVNLENWYNRFRANGTPSNSQKPNTLDIVHLVVSDLRMKPSVRDAIRSENGWGYNKDIIFFNQRDLFRTILKLFDRTHPNFRPCMKWLLVTLDDTYVDTQKLWQVLVDLNFQRPTYLGNPVRFPKRSKSCRYDLKNLFEPDVKFATFSSGFVLSRGLLELLKEKIMQGVRPIMMGYDITRSYCYDFDLNDARLAACIYNSLGISLSNDMRFGGSIESAPMCPDIFPPSRDYVTLPHSSPGLPCRKRRDPRKVQEVMNRMVRVMTTYEGDRANAIASAKLHINSGSYLLTPGHRYVFNASQIIVFDDPGVNVSSYPAGTQVRTTPACMDTGNDASFHCVQEKMSLAVYAMAHYILKNEHIEFGIFGDSDQSLNILAIAEVLSDRIDPQDVLMIGDVKWGHSQYPYVSGGAYVQTRAWFVEYHKYASSFYEQHGVLPLMDRRYKRKSLNGIHGCDSYFTYVTFRMGGDVVQLPGWYGFSSLCVLPRQKWDIPILAVHGLVANGSSDERYNDNVLGPKYLHEADSVYKGQERKFYKPVSPTP